jgi:hypothetical protein
VSSGDGTAFVTVVEGFGKAAKTRDVAGMKAQFTRRLSSSVDEALDKYGPRLWGRVDELAAGIGGGFEIGQVSPDQGGRTEVEIRYKSGDSTKLMFVNEAGQWKLDRL